MCWCLQSSSASSVSTLCVCPSWLPMWSGLHCSVGLVHHTGQKANGSQQSVGTSHVCHCNLCDGGSEGPPPGPQLATTSSSRSLRSLYLPVGVQLGLGADIYGCVSLGLLRFYIQPVWTSDPGVHVALECGSTYSRAACNQKHFAVQTAPINRHQDGSLAFWTSNNLCLSL